MESELRGNIFGVSKALQIIITATDGGMHTFGQPNFGYSYQERGYAYRSSGYASRILDIDTQ